MFSHILSVRQYILLNSVRTSISFLKLRKLHKTSSENSDRYWRVYGSGQGDHWRHLLSDFFWQKWMTDRKEEKTHFVGTNFLQNFLILHRFNISKHFTGSLRNLLSSQYFQITLKYLTWVLYWKWNFIFSCDKNIYNSSKYGLLMTYYTLVMYPG